jgi:hypothetical protein
MEYAVNLSRMKNDRKEREEMLDSSDREVLSRE